MERQISKDRLIWLDMEMTGLDPATCVPLQVAVVITTNELVELASVEITMWQPDACLSAIEPFVRNMHTQNGLLDAVRKSTTSVGEAERVMLGMLSQWTAYRDGVLCGNSIHTDRRFLERYFPVFEGYLHYRMIDVSSLKELARRWYGQQAVFDKGAGLHTALSDIRESIAELRFYREQILKNAPTRPAEK